MASQLPPFHGGGLVRSEPDGKISTLAAFTPWAENARCGGGSQRRENAARSATETENSRGHLRHIHSAAGLVSRTRRCCIDFSGGHARFPRGCFFSSRDIVAGLHGVSGQSDLPSGSACCPGSHSGMARQGRRDGGSHFDADREQIEPEKIDSAEQFHLSDQPSDQIGAHSVDDFEMAMSLAPIVSKASEVPSPLESFPFERNPRFEINNAIEVATGLHFHRDLIVKGAVGRE